MSRASLPLLPLPLGAHRHVLRRGAVCYCVEAFDAAGERLFQSPNYKAAGGSDGGNAELAQNCDDDPMDYWSDGVGRAFWKVFCAPELHYERMNAWSHAVGAMLAAAALGSLYALPVFRGGGARVVLSRAAAAASVATFVASTLFHTLRTVRSAEKPYKASLVATLVYALDQLCIFASLGLSGAADAAAWVGPSPGWRTVADPAIAAGVCALFLSLRHAVFDKTPWVYTSCSLGLARFFTYDGMHQATLGAITLCIVLGQFLPAPALAAQADGQVLGPVLGMTIAALLLLTVGQGLDAWGLGVALEEAARRGGVARRLFFLPRSAGAVCSAHSLWHALAVLALLTNLFAREYLLSVTD